MAPTLDVLVLFGLNLVQVHFDIERVDIVEFYKFTQSCQNLCYHLRVLLLFMLDKGFKMVVRPTIVFEFLGSK